MKARIRRISASVDTAISFGSSASADATCSTNTSDLNSSTEMPHGYNPSSKSLDICVPESRIERMRKLLSSPLLRRRNASQHGPNCNSHAPHVPHCKQMPPSSSSSSSPSSSPALGSSSNSSMKTFGVSLESLSNHQHPHHHQQQHNGHYPEYPEYVRDPEQIVVPHQKAAHVLGQVCPGCLTSAPSNSSSTGSINDTTTTTTSSGHFSHHVSSHTDDFITSSISSSIVASPSSGTSSSSTTSSTSSAGGPTGNPCLIPFIVTRLCNYIENSGGISHEGLFRISGNAKLVEKLKQSFDVTGDAPLETEGDLASAAALLKQFLRELPQPLIPNGLQFVDVIRCIVFAPNIFRVSMDSYQGLKDQSSANEVVNLLITEFSEIFNETVGGTGSSREDLSSAISCDSECPFTCSLNIEIPKSEVMTQSKSNCESLLLTLEAAPDKDGGEEQARNSNDARLELDRKRKDYKSKNHRTIDEFDDERCQSFDCGLGVPASQKQPPQRCNSDGNSDELSVDSATLTSNATEDNGLRKQCANSQTHEIIITNSSDSVSTDDNTTTTATTGATVCSVVINGQLAAQGLRNDRLLSSSDDNPDKSSSFTSSDPKLLGCENALGEMNVKTGRSGSCGSDCTENIPIFTSDDEQEEDSLSKSIASDCSGDSNPSTTSSSCSSHVSGNEAGSSSSLNENNGAESQPMERRSAGHNADRPWQVSADDENSEQNMPQLSRLMYESSDSSIMFDFMRDTQVGLAVDTATNQANVPCEEAPVSPSAFRSHLSNRLEQTALPPSPPVTNEAAMYAFQRRAKESKFEGKFIAEQLPCGGKSINKMPGLRARNRRFQSIRRKLRQFDIDFEQENGYRPTYDHKMVSSFARPLMIELSSLLNVRTSNLRNLDYYDIECDSMEESDQVDLESLSAKARANVNWKYGPEVSPSVPMSTDDIFNTIFGNPKEKSLTKISEMMDEIQKTLREKRILANRPDSIDEMTPEQIQDEKLALQKALLRFEAEFGRPSCKAERAIVRPVYDRYRQIKRYAARLSQKSNSKDAASELQPILENQVCSFKSPTHSRSSSVQIPDAADATTSPGGDSNLTSVTPIPPSSSSSTVLSCPAIVVSSNQKSSCDMSTNHPNLASKNFHEMSLEELLIQQRELRQQKRNLHAVLRTFEHDFYKKTGRPVEKEDRCELSSVYYCYKNTKAKMRLIQALVAKIRREQNDSQNG